jgi:hypothetical protein
MTAISEIPEPRCGSLPEDASFEKQKGRSTLEVTAAALWVESSRTRSTFRGRLPTRTQSARSVQSSVRSAQLPVRVTHCR